MKRLISTLALVFASISFVSAQKIVKDEHGNFKSSATVKAAKDSTDTGLTYEHSDGKKYKVYRGPRGGLYAWVPIKNGELRKKSMPKGK